MSAEAIGVVVVIVLALLTLAVAWGTVLTRQKDMKEDIDELKGHMSDSDSIREGLKIEYLTEKQHDLLCLNTTLRFEKHVTKVVNDMGEKLVKKIEVIVNGGE